MNLNDIERHAKALMTVHGVGHLEFKWSNGKKTIGYCRSVRVQTSDNTHIWVAKSIHLSKLFAQNLSEAEIQDTILHEIAHAKAGHGAGHGAKWRSIARSLGATPKPCAAVSYSPEKAWKASCPACGKSGGAQHRAPLRVYLCGKPTCKSLPYSQRMLVWKKNGKNVPLCEMPNRFYNEITTIMARARQGAKGY